MYLISKRKAKVAHIWTGRDTVCRMFSTGGMNQRKYAQASASELPVCQLCAGNRNNVKVAKTEHGKCNKCGLPISWGKNKNGKPIPLNPDLTEHWDKCSEARAKRNAESGKIHIPISSGVITGANFIETDCDCLPWAGCEKCSFEAVANRMLDVQQIYALQ